MTTKKKAKKTSKKKTIELAPKGRQPAVLVDLPDQLAKLRGKKQIILDRPKNLSAERWVRQVRNKINANSPRGKFATRVSADRNQMVITLR